jgi:hypothetical protein
MRQGYGHGCPRRSFYSRQRLQVSVKCKKPGTVNPFRASCLVYVKSPWFLGPKLYGQRSEDFGCPLRSRLRSVWVAGARL